ncbi:putative leucine-rich repeat domain, L domain-containing protein [Medicago truncatula]|uniref:Putative leucine-rich repeat domain, L domain-containing protein n=1 Tax=Medicago truncatula TaxID=3880 RepID=A0A396J2V1_MEDTR|nr:receptor-like protein EIX2 [Medicago truncatula]RHN72170.1 putative leucine-rich repeat domain, L domain-containing protein [Medicago truncatula]
MSSLLELHLASCGISSLPPTSPFLNITPLSVLDLSGNPLNTSMPSWLFNMSTLTELNLYASSLIGPIPSMFGRWNLCQIQYLVLGLNDLIGDITELIEALSCSNQSLEFLDLRFNQLTGKLPHSLGKFTSLFYLDLSTNPVNSHTISGPIPTSIGNLSNLVYLNVDNNKLNGKIPESIGKLTNLHSLHLRENYWEGTLTNLHFHNLTNLVYLSVSSKKNSLSFKVTNDWVPPFKNLFHLEISGCDVGPTFPNWLRELNSLNDIILKNAGISGIIPHWLYNMSSQISQLDLSHNKISGYFPKKMNFTSSNLPRVDFSFNQLKGSVPLWSGVSGLYLRNNLLSGTVPTNIGEEMSNLIDLDLSNNNLNGRIPISLNEIQNLNHLDLSYNYLFGEIPEFWMGMQSLQIIDLSNNNLSELLLRGNILTGSIPKELCGLRSLHILDLAENNLSGSIPTCFGDVEGFKVPQTYFIDLIYSITDDSIVPYTRHTELVINRRIVKYLKQMPVHSIIDLSKNYLSGEIPEKITQLIHLGALNLSWNQLTGNIPNNIGSLIDLENLDLSHNNLSGPVPPSMASMTFLSHLNLSYNNLSEQIPMANQFGTFNEPAIYEGNPGLCGYPAN